MLCPIRRTQRDAAVMLYHNQCWHRLRAGTSRALGGTNLSARVRDPTAGESLLQSNNRALIMLAQAREIRAELIFTRGSTQQAWI